MSTFAIVAALLAVAAVAILAYAMRGGSDQKETGARLRELLLERERGALTADEFERRQAELHARLLAPPRSGLNRWQLLALAAFVAAAAGLYLWLGRPQAVDRAPPAPVASTAAPGGAGGDAAGHSGVDMGVAVQRLAARLEKSPDDGAGWELLARSYIELHRYPEAADAFGRAARLLPADATLLADYADAQVMANGRRWNDKAVKTVQQALAADPRHMKALALAGSEAFERADYRNAIAYWERLTQAAPPGSADGAEAAANVEEAKRLLGGGSGTAAAAPAAAIAGSVRLAEALRAKTPPEATVFVVAKAPDSPGPPLAVLRLQAKDLPASFRLDDRLAMMPGRNLSAFKEALVQARLSLSGEAATKPGDAASDAVRVRIGAEGIALEIR